MSNFIASITSWVRSKNITSHSVAVAAVAFATLYTTDDQFRNFVIAAFQNHPKILADITLAAGIILKYMHSSSPAGTVASAQVIEAAPNPPTRAAVNAADTSKP
jgi:hypothetical protein